MRRGFVAGVRRDKGNYTEAEALQAAVLAVTQRVMGEAHPLSVHRWCCAFFPY